MSACNICRCPCTNYENFTEKTYQEYKAEDPKLWNLKMCKHYWTNAFCKWCFHEKESHRITFKGRCFAG